MSGLIDYIPCPQCKNMAAFELNSKTFEQWLTCPACGFNQGVKALRDRKSKNGGYKLKKNGGLIYRKYKLKGNGAYNFHFKDGIDAFGGFKKPITDQDIARFNKNITREDIDQEQSYMTRWDDDANQIISVVGKFKSPLADDNKDGHFEEISDSLQSEEDEIPF